MKIDADKMSREIKFVKISSLRPYEKNARTHSDSQIKKIAASITEFGFTNPILIDGEKGIIAGHGRLAAAKLLGLDDVPVIELTHMTEAQKRAYVISDNSIALQSGWNMDILAEELKAIENDGMNLELTGFSEDELKTIMLPGFLDSEKDRQDIQPEYNDERENENSDDDSIRGESLGTHNSTKQMKYLTVSNLRVPLTESEENLILKAINEYVERNGTSFGFVNGLFL